MCVRILEPKSKVPCCFCLVFLTVASQRIGQIWENETDLWSSVEMQTSTMSEPNGMLGGNMTCDRPLRELTGVPDDREEAEELESEPWEEDFWEPLATEEERQRSSNSNVSTLITEHPDKNKQMTLDTLDTYTYWAICILPPSPYRQGIVLLPVKIRPQICKLDRVEKLETFMGSLYLIE